MKNIDFRECYTKELLRNILKLKTSKFKSWMRTIEPDILGIEPTYSRNSAILTPKVFKFILSEYGFEDADEINEKIEAYYQSIGIHTTK